MVDYPITLTRSRVKNLTINSYCDKCKKPLSWNGTLVMGSALEEGSQEVPETCTCQWNLNTTAIIPIAPYGIGGNVNSMLVTSGNAIETVSKSEYEQLEKRVKALEDILSLA